MGDYGASCDGRWHGAMAANPCGTFANPDSTDVETRNNRRRFGCDKACALTSDLSEVVDSLLAACFARERAKRDLEQRGIDALIAATNDFVARHGLPGADHSPV